MNIHFGGHDIKLLPEGAIWIDSRKLLCVADLHFEKDSFFHHFGTFLPPYGSWKTLERLEKIISRYKPDIFIAAGDSFHDKRAADRMKPEIVEKLNEMVDLTKEWRWVMGNHDPEIAPHIKGYRNIEWSQEGIVFRHQAIMTDEYEVSGHFHPKVGFSLRGHSFRLPCFVRQGRKLFLPAFGTYTGGLDINSPAFKAVAPEEGREVFIIHHDEVIAFGQ